MKLTSVNLNDTEYQFSNGDEYKSNTFTIIIGKNGTGKSRLLAKIADTLLQAKRYRQNHPILKQNKVKEMAFKSNDKIITINSAKGKRGRILEKNKLTKEYMCKKLIVASISPFDKFPLPEQNLSYRNNEGFYNYVGFKTDKNSLSDKNLLTRFATSIVSSQSNVAVKRTLRLLGYKSDIFIRFKHNSDRYFKTNNYSRSNLTFNEIVLNNKELYSKVLDDNNYLMSKLILKELSRDSNTIIGKKTINDLIGNKNLPEYYSTSNELDDNLRSSLIRSLELNISEVSSITLRKIGTNDNLTLNDASSGERSLLLLVCSIASQITSDSVILIDEPEISLHPEWQETFIDLISKAFENYHRCHFIIATHSPLVISNLPKENCYILNMDSNKTVDSEEYFNKSADFQLAKLFNTPGFQNEYLNRLCISILSDFSEGKFISEEQEKNIKFLISIQNELDERDTVKSLIEIIKKATEVSKSC
ncbi:TPA: AAA family ATPase [Vibrio cholerae]|uniref:ATP-binding protein n=1 Tax=Vibrio cholerae TaxID=666 RepID=A0A5Q6PCV4_VIBCL|nr:MULTISPECIES: ATP-binding protein [Vibrio]EGQ8391373.1 AAA family ATPase [Vibrio cholerae]EGR5155424.1 ATP-binding protein [Vibrio cholerae]EHU6506916.1 ATP-binding protein [Vibrio cholerae]EHY0954821.1 ATP-binding protein [Vibrio cholerae]EIC9845510.1 ATP-binding protein [Vibrio cholerae]